MSLLDWTVFFAFIAWVVADGVRRTRRDADAEELFLAGRRAPWWVMGLSIIATQASAITLVGTTGKGWEDGLRFVQFYYGLPIAMVILAFTLLPLYRRHRVFTAYEYLGRRFGERTRLLSAAVFLVLRGLSVGIVIAAPSIVLSAALGIPLGVAVLAMGAIAVGYTAFGGMRAVLSTDVKQVSVMVVGVVVALVFAVRALPDDVGLAGALRLADATDRLVLADWRWAPGEQYTVWSALLGGTLLFLAYFGCDQSQAQRYLSGRSLAAERGALALNAGAKIPFQLLVLLTGTVLFALYTLEPPPASFVPEEARVAAAEPELVGNTREEWERARAAARALLAAPDGDTVAAEAFRAASASAEAARERARERLRQVGAVTSDETNYVFLHFIRENLPIGVVGLLFAAILAAALSSIDSELNAMATVALMDIHPRGRRRALAPAEERRLARLAVAGLGALATGFAFLGTEGSLIEAVNSVGSWFYGALLGVFVLAVAAPRVGEVGAVAGIVAGIAAVGVAEWIAHGRDGEVAFLYRNTIGTAATVTFGLIVAELVPRPPAGRADAGASPASASGGGGTGTRAEGGARRAGPPPAAE